MSSVAAINKFFAEGPHGRKVELAEFRALSARDRDELGRLCCVALGVEWCPAKQA